MWTFPQTQYRNPVVPDVGSHLTGLAQHFTQQRELARRAEMQKAQMEAQQQYRSQQMGLQQKRLGIAQTNAASARDFRNKQFKANQDYRNRALGLQEKRLSQPRGGPNSELQRRKLELQIKKMEQGPQLNPLERQKLEIMKSLMGGGQPAAPAQPPATLQPQSHEMAPNDPNLIPTQTTNAQPAAPQSPISNLSPEQRQAMALNLVSPGLGNPLLANAKGEKFGKATTNKIEGKILDTAEGMSRLSTIQQSFKPEFLTYRGGIKGAWAAIKDKAQIGTLAPDERTYLTEFTQFKQDAWDNLNRYIKEITGAQMSEAEAARLTRSMPNPGKNFWDGDSPTQFKSKMDNTIGQLKLAAARYNFLRSARFKASGGGGTISLQKMRGIINKRAVEIRNQLRISNPGADRKLIEQQAYRQTAQEFGI